MSTPATDHAANDGVGEVQLNPAVRTESGEDGNDPPGAVAATAAEKEAELNGNVSDGGDTNDDDVPGPAEAGDTDPVVVESSGVSNGGGAVGSASIANTDTEWRAATEEEEKYEYAYEYGKGGRDVRGVGDDGGGDGDGDERREGEQGVMGGGEARRGDGDDYWFASDPSKAYYERFSLTWAPLSMFLLLVVLLGTSLYKYCDRRSYLLISCMGCLPGFVVPLWRPCAADRLRPWHERFWVKATVWISIFGFYGNYFWTHYFYSLLGAEYLFDSYRFNDVPLVTYVCTFFYFTFYFSFVNVVLRRVRAFTADFPPFGRRAIWVFTITSMAYATALFEALSIQHFPLYTYKQRDLFLLVGSVVYGLYFVVGFPMFFFLDEDDPVDRYRSPSSSSLPTNGYHHDRTPLTTTTTTTTQQYNRTTSSSLKQVALNAFAACAIVTLLLDLWRLFIGSIYDLGTAQNSSVPLPFVYQQAADTVAQQTQQAVCSMPPIPSPDIVYVQQPVTADACMEIAKGWAKRKVENAQELVENAQELVYSLAKMNK